MLKTTQRFFHSRPSSILVMCLCFCASQFVLATWALAQDNAQLANASTNWTEQIIDLKVEIGTLESLARSRPADRVGGQSYSNDRYNAGRGNSARLDGLETQIRALTAQIESLTREVRVLKGQQGGAGTGPTYGGAPPGGNYSNYGDAYGGQPSGFGSTTVTQPVVGVHRQAADMLHAMRQQNEPYAGSGYAGGQAPKRLYETAYGYLLQQDYGAAQSAFSDFLSRYPKDRLAGNAQYWLGETHYVRGQYRSAASAFLKGYKSYSKSQRRQTVF